MLNRLRGQRGSVFLEGLAIVVVAVVVVLIVATVIAWPFKKVNNGLIGLSYGGGIVEGQHFQGVYRGPTGLFANGFGDKLYTYPTTLRTYIVSNVAGEGDREGGDVIVALDSNGVAITYEVAVYFKLNQDLVRQFHESIGIKYHAWCDGGATNCSEGWEHMLNDTMRQQLENALQAATRTHSTDEFLKTETLRLIQNEVELNLKDNVNEVLGDGADAEYFCGPDYVPGAGACPDFSVVIKKPTLPQGVVEQYQAVQESEIAIETKRNEVQQALEESKAIRARQEALEECGQACILYDAVHSGQIKFWVLNGEDLTIQGPQP